MTQWRIPSSSAYPTPDRECYILPGVQKRIMLTKLTLRKMKGGHKMPYIVVKTCFPNERAKEAANKFLETQEKYPPDETFATVVLDTAINVDEMGIHGLYIVEPKDGKFLEAFQRTEAAMVEYHDVPDYRYEIKIWATAEEALKYIGMG